jgi:hypothetical protein
VSHEHGETISEAFPTGLCVQAWFWDRGLVGIFQGNQPIIFLRSIGSLDPLDPLVSFLTQIVDVHAASQAGLHGFPEFARLPHALFSL